MCFGGSSSKSDGGMSSAHERHAQLAATILLTKI
jgi:hypothetical protein